MFSSSFTMSEQEHRQWTPYKQAGTINPNVRVLLERRAMTDGYCRRCRQATGRAGRDASRAFLFAILAGCGKTSFFIKTVSAPS